MTNKSRPTSGRSVCCFTSVLLLGISISLPAQDPKQSHVPITRPQEVIATVDGRGSAAGYVELPDGSILMAHEVAGERGPRFSTSQDGGVTWSEPAKPSDITGEPLKGMGEFNLIRLRGNAIGYLGRTRNAPGEPSFLMFWRSEDVGKTWQEPTRVHPPMPFTIATVNNILLRTTSGRIILPAYSCMNQAAAGPRRITFEEPSIPRTLGGLMRDQWIGTGAHHLDSGFCWSFVYYSDDDARTWKRSRGGEIYIWESKTMGWSMTAEPSVAEVEPGALLMYMRTDWGRLFKSWSFDNGETWSAPTATPLSASGAPGQIKTIPGTGDLLVVWSQESPEEMKQGLIRNRLSSAVSRTNGSIWEHFQNVDSTLEGAQVEPGPVGFYRPEGMVAGPTEPAPNREGRYIVDLPDDYCRCSYPSVFFWRDRVLIGHTYAHYDENNEYVMPGRLRVLPIKWLYGGDENNMKPNERLKRMFPLPQRENR